MNRSKVWSMGCLFTVVFFCVTTKAHSCRNVCSVNGDVYILCGLGDDVHYQLLGEGEVLMDQLICHSAAYPTAFSPETSADQIEAQRENIRLVNYCYSAENPKITLETELVQRQRVRLANPGQSSTPTYVVQEVLDEVVWRMNFQKPQVRYEEIRFARAECGSASER